MIKLTAIPDDNYNQEIPLKLWKFPGGEVGVKIESLRHIHAGVLCIRVDWRGNDDLMYLANLVDAIRRETLNPRIRLIIPYMPYARQDRVCNRGESHALKVFANIINAMGFEDVTVYDAHSYVMEGVFDRLTVIPQENIMRYLSSGKHFDVKNTVIVAPDEGATKKAYKVAKEMGVEEVITCIKERNPATGEIVSVKPNVKDGYLTDKDLLVVDDICDGGRTFVELYSVIKGLTTGKTMLSVTHGIFSKGIEPLLDYDKIFVVNCMHDGLTHPKLFVKPN